MVSRAYRAATILLPPVTVSLAAGVALLPNTIFVDKMKAMVRSYRAGNPVGVSPKIHELFVKVKADLIDAEHLQEHYEVTTEKLNSITPFTVFGFDMYRMGWLKFGYEGFVGVPEYFAVGKDEKIPTDSIKVDRKSIDWSSDAGKTLKESLTNSEEVKKFAIAREILHLCQDDVELKMGINAWNSMLVVLLGFGVYDKLRTKPKPILAVLSAMILTTGIGFYFLLKDVSTCSRESGVDEALCKLGVKYSMGGTEYYYSLMKRNIALRALSGGVGERTYTAYGNEKRLIRQPNVPLSERAEFCRSQLQSQLKENKAAEDDKS